MFDECGVDGVALHERDGVAREEVVSCLRWLGGHDWVVLFRFVAELQVVILPGAASIRLLI